MFKARYFGKIYAKKFVSCFVFKFKFNTNEIFSKINKWFRSNLLMLNYDKTYFAIFN